MAVVVNFDSVYLDSYKYIHAMRNKVFNVIKALINVINGIKASFDSMKYQGLE